MSTANCLNHDYSLRHFENVNDRPYLTQNQLSHRINANVTDNKIASRLLISTKSIRTLKEHKYVGTILQESKSRETQQSLVNTERLTDMLQWPVSGSLRPNCYLSTSFYSRNWRLTTLVLLKLFSNKA